MKKNILIIGGNGTLGTALSEVLYGKCNLFIASRGEENQKRYFEKYPEAKMIIADCGSRESVSDMLNMAARDGVIDLVIHCAAMKHVNVCEDNPGECARINVTGTLYVADECVRRHIDSAIFISSDKSVDPISTYGASKLMAERIWLSGNSMSRSKMSVIRSGNIYGSRGSVIPFWEEKAKRGEDIPITSRNMIRYWISPEALANFIVARAEEMKGGEIFIPDCALRSAYEIAVDINNQYGGKSKIIDVGLRPGERLDESLYGKHESVTKTEWGYLVKGN
jgi:FlaA1/EpsC-like NDP-sugar epimerase